MIKDFKTYIGEGTLWGNTIMRSDTDRVRKECSNNIPKIHWIDFGPDCDFLVADRFYEESGEQLFDQKFAYDNFSNMNDDIRMFTQKEFLTLSDNVGEIVKKGNFIQYYPMNDYENCIKVFFVTNRFEPTTTHIIYSNDEDERRPDLVGAFTTDELTFDYDWNETNYILLRKNK